MKKFAEVLIAIIMVILFISCSSNSKLKQENAEKTLQGYAKNSLSQYLDEATIQSILSIEPVVQFSETEASTIVRLNIQPPLELKASFKKNIDGYWILTSVEAASFVGNTPGKYLGMINHNINITVE